MLTYVGIFQLIGPMQRFTRECYGDLLSSKRSRNYDNRSTERGEVSTDPLYDDRITQVLKNIDPVVDLRDLIIQQENSEASHEADARPGPQEIAARYHLDAKLCEPLPKAIAVCDDVLTTGARYKAAKLVLSARFPGLPLIGIFIARRIPETIDVDIFRDV